MQLLKRNPLAWLMLLAALWACLGAQTMGLKTASGQIYGFELASWESTPLQAAPRLGLRALEEISVSAPPVGANPPSWTPGKIQDISLNAAEHWTKHGREFPGIKSANEYVEAANKFVLNPPPSVQTFNRSNGDKLFYDPVSNTFAVQASTGMPRTMFRPDSADLYWLKQTGFTK